MSVLSYNCKTKQTTYREYTEEEIMEQETFAKVEPIPQMPTDTERIEALEMALLELAEVIANGQILCITNQTWENHTGTSTRKMA